MAGECPEIPVIIGGEEVRTGDMVDVVMPHRHGHVIAKAHMAGPAEAARAIDAAEAARHDWQALPWEERASVLLRAADLLAGPWRDTINASTMLGQSKTSHQAEIDAACEMADFFRFNAHYAVQLYQEQPESADGIWNRLEHRPLALVVLRVEQTAVLDQPFDELLLARARRLVQRRIAVPVALIQVDVALLQLLERVDRTVAHR